MPCPDHPKAHFPVPADEVCGKHLILPVGKAGKAEQKMLPGQSLANDWQQPENKFPASWKRQIWGIFDTISQKFPMRKLEITKK